MSVREERGICDVGEKTAACEKKYCFNEWALNTHQVDV